MKLVKLSQKHLEMKSLTASEEGRYAIDCLQVTRIDEDKARVDATDGRVLVTYDAEMIDADKLPKFQGAELPIGESVQINPDAAKAMLAAIDKRKKAPEVDRFIYLTVGEKTDDGYQSILSHRKGASYTSHIQGSFPNVVDMIPQETVLKIAFSPGILAALASWATLGDKKDYQGNAQALVFSFSSSEKPVRITQGDDVVAVVAPVRIKVGDVLDTADRNGMWARALQAAQSVEPCAAD